MRPARWLVLVLPGLFVGGCRRGATWTAPTPALTSRLEVVARDGRHCVRLAAREQGCFDAVDVRTVAFDSLGARAAYAVRVGTRWAVAVDGRTGALWDAVGAPRMSPDGAHVAYPAEARGRWHVVRDDSAGASFDAVRAGTLRFDATGRRLAYVARRGTALHVVDDGIVSEAWREVGDLAFAPRRAGAGVLFYTAQDATGWRVVRDGAAGPRWPQVRDLRVAPDGRAAHVVATGGREAVVTDSVPSRWHTAVLGLSLTDDGRGAYVARDDTLLAAWLMDGTRLAAGEVHDVALGAAGRAAWVRATGERHAIVAPHGTFVFDLVVAGTLQFTDDGAQWTALVGDRARRELRVVVDGRVRGRRLDWEEVTRRVQQGAGAEGLRTWVAAEARRLIAADPPSMRTTGRR